jgi:hypothetical protein
MPTQILDYRNGKNVEDIIDYVVYNDLAGTVTLGDVYFLSYEKDADSLSPSERPTLSVCAQTAVPRKVVVALETFADQARGRVRFQGYCPVVKCANTIEIDDYLQGTNTSQTAADDGTTVTTDSFGISVSDEDVTAGFCEAVLFGQEVIIG